MHELQADNEFGRLHLVLLSKGNSLYGKEEQQQFEQKYGGNFNHEATDHPESGSLDVEKAKAQHRALIALLQKHGVQVLFCDDVPEAAHQIFTRDVGVVIGDTFYVTRLGDGIRRLEQQGLKKSIVQFPKVAILDDGIIEGGDIFVHDKQVFVGITKYSTNMYGFNCLKKHLSPRGYTCHAIRLAPTVLHLDCRFNIVSPSLALCYAEDIHHDDVVLLRKHFEIIPVPTTEVATMGCNVVLLSPKEIIIDNRNKHMTSVMRNKGFSVHEIAYDEISKLWGSVRCTTLPLYRES